MKLLKKSTLFKRAEVEMTKEEYKAYKFGSFQGRIEGTAFGIIITTIIVYLTYLL